MIRSLSRGEVGCLRSGTYRARRGQIKISRPGITLTSYPGERARLVGRLWLTRRADRARIRRLRLDGRNRRGLPSPTVNATGTAFRKNNVTNRHTAICFILGSSDHGHASRTLIVRNRIHDCGELPATNHQHGIYVAHSRRSVIRNNLIYDNADRGIQLYPNADETTIRGNVIDRNGQGVLFSGDRNDASSRNLVVRNLITFSTIRHNVESHWQGPTGSGNLVRENCIFGGARNRREGGIETPPDGFTLSRNVIARPRYLDRSSGDFRLRRGSRCRGVLPRAS